MERRLAAILAADIVGYSRLMGDDEAGTLTRLKAQESDVIEPAVAKFSGRIVKRMGDGYLVAFASVVNAVDCALAWQASPAEDPLRFRIGINLGDVIAEEGDLYGDGVNVAARLEGLAPPGGICLSEDTYRQARGKVDAEFEDLGEQKLKNIAEKLRVYQVAADSQGPPQTAPAEGGAAPWRQPVVLLVPFRALGSAAEAEALAAGVTETLAAALSVFEEFELIDPGSAAGPLAAQGGLATGRKLGATYILEGTIQVAPGKARIGVQLIEADSGQRVWSETQDHDLEDSFALQDDITAFVASTMGEAVGEEQARAIAQKEEADLNPYELNVRGIQHLHRVNPEDNQEARRLFETSRARVPGEYFPALCLCWTYAVELLHGWPPSRADTLDYALEQMRDVVRGYDRSAHAHRLLGRLYFFTRDYDQALAHSERCHRLNPHHSDMILSHGLALLWCGRAAEGLPLIERALRVNPYAPPYYKVYLSLAYFISEHPERGLAILEDVERTVGHARYLRIANLMAAGRQEQARAEAEQARTANPDFDLTRLLAGFSFKRQEDRDKIREALTAAGLGNP